MSHEVRHGPLSEGPACEPKMLIVQVLGKDHPAGHEFVLRDGYRDTDLDQPSKEPLEIITEPRSVLHKWRWKGMRPADIQLEIATERGAPIRLPLFEGLWETPRQRRYQHYIIQPVMPMALWKSMQPRSAWDASSRTHALPVRPGYLYLFYRDRLWREIEVRANPNTGQLEFRDIDLAAHRDADGRYQDDRRPSAGVPLHEVWVPRPGSDRAINHVVGHNPCMAYSEVQWSAARLNYLQDDARARQARCQRLNLLSGNDFASSGYLYTPPDDEPQRLREWGAELQVANPAAMTRDLAGQHLAQLHAQANREIERFEADGASASAAADAGLQAFTDEGDESLLYRQAMVRAQVLDEGLAAQEQTGHDNDLWQGLDAAQDCLADARTREIPAVLLDDPLFDLRHALSGCQASERYLLGIPRRAARNPRFECATLVNRTLLTSHDSAGEANPLHRFVDDDNLDLDDSGDLAFVLCQAQREVAHDQHAAYQDRLADLLAALGKSGTQIDQLATERQDRPTPAQRLLVRCLGDGSGHPLHAMLFPSDEATPLAAPLTLPEEGESNPGDGRLRLKSMARQAELELPTDADDLQLIDTPQLAMLVGPEGLPVVPELKRWAGAVDTVLGKLGQQATLMLNGVVDQATALTLFPPVVRLSRAALPDLLVGVHAVPPAEAHGKVILGVLDETDGLTEADRRHFHDRLATFRRHLDSSVTEASGRTLNSASAQALTSARGDQAVTVLAVDPDSLAAEVARKARARYSLSRSAEAIRLPYIIAVIEIFNLRMELVSTQNRSQARAGAAIFSAYIDITVASAKALEFFGERHNQLVQLRAKVISRKVPWGSLLARLAPKAAQWLPSVIALSTLGAAAGGVITAMLCGWDAMTSLRNGNLGAGIALGVAAVSGLVVTAASVMVGMGPVGWIAIGVTLAAAAWLADSELEEWLRMGPFGPQAYRDRAPWLQNPDEAYDRLVSLLAGIRIRIDSIAPTTAEAVAASSLPAIGLLPESTTRPMTTLERLAGDHKARDEARSYEHYRSLPNTRIVVESNLAGLAAGWEPVVWLYPQRAIDRPAGHMPGNQVVWQRGDFVPSARPIEPRFTRATAHGMEYYVMTLDAEIENGLRGRPKRRIRYGWTVRVQWRRERRAPRLPGILPAPAPLVDPASIDPDDRRRPDPERREQAYWASEASHPDDSHD
ncbi:hypothetical protein GCM10007160_05170 [Litchfieldella qijiaojingensis]|uniref:Uncharacterized protein n=1 Tax=Litchfieldella qijiaojingensis TaxID=980347 RepID=A0ABQ2YEC8_9GAMM|nr:ammonium transporter [Halomonas qijiaojingensis]GGX80919.1 hypothetical protein GCM10007160_05170 [Halomonas qijiaojingensis]